MALIRADREAISEIIGADFVDTVAPHDQPRDPSWSPVRARPGTALEIARVIALAARRDWVVVPIGAGTQIRDAFADTASLLHALRRLSPRDRPLPDLIIALDRLDEIVEHSPADLVAGVQCGISLSRAQSRLRAHGQWIPIDPWVAPGATVGGALAMNRFGPRRLRYGTARDWVIGTTVVRPDGAIVRAGGMVVKNVSGYDLSKLYLGSRGALGILVQANFKLSPVPIARALLRARLSGDRSDRSVWDAFEAFWNGDWPLAAATLTRSWAKPSLRPISEIDVTDTLALEFEGSAEILAARRDRALDLVRRAGLRDLDWIVPDPDPGVRIRGDASLAGADRSGRFVRMVRMHYPPATYVALISALRGLPRQGAPALERTFLGSGVSWLSWEQDPDPESVERLGSVVRGAGGFVVAEREPPRTWPAGGGRQEDPVRNEKSADRTSRELEARLVLALNPKGTVRPGIPLPWLGDSR